MVPLALNVALAAGGSPLVFALVVALSASNNFLSASSPVLAMVSGPAGYTPRDLWGTGLPLTFVDLGIVPAGGRSDSLTLTATRVSEWPRQGPATHSPRGRSLTCYVRNTGLLFTLSK